MSVVQASVVAVLAVVSGALFVAGVVWNFGVGWALMAAGVWVLVSGLFILLYDGGGRDQVVRRR